MARYEKRETTGIFDGWTGTRRFEIKDTRTGRIGEGTASTRERAEDNAWKDLKYGDYPISLDTGEGGAPSSVGEFPIGIIGLFALLVFGLWIFLWASILLWFGLFAMCFLLIFTKPLRGILGFGIAALSLYLAVRIDMEGGKASNFPVWIACTILIWLAPLMALAQKPLYVLLAFVLCPGIPVGLLFWGIPYFTEHYPELAYGDMGVLGALGIIVASIVLLMITIVTPFCLMVKAFSE